MSIKKITYELGLKHRKGYCPLEQGGLKDINYKDIELIRKFITEKGKIIPKRITGVSAVNQKKLAHAIKRARNLALLSFTQEESTTVVAPAGSIYNISTTSDITHDADYVSPEPISNDDGLENEGGSVETKNFEEKEEEK